MSTKSEINISISWDIFKMKIVFEATGRKLISESHCSGTIKRNRGGVTNFLFHYQCRRGNILDAMICLQYDMLTSFMLIKKECTKCEKSNLSLRKLSFETFLTNLFSNLHPICKNYFRKSLFQFAKLIQNPQSNKVNWSVKQLINSFKNNLIF